MKMKVHIIVIVVLLFLGFLILLHQFLVWGMWFQIEDVHHETFALMCLAAALGILFGKALDHFHGK
jgi:hypothetical protein